MKNFHDLSKSTVCIDYIMLGMDYAVSEKPNVNKFDEFNPTQLLLKLGEQ